MAKKMIRPIRNEAEYDQALEEIEQYFENEPKPGAPEADRFDLLALVVEDCERKRWPIEPPETIDAIRYRMETSGYTQADLGRLLSSRQRPEQEARPRDENGLETAPRLEHPGGGADRATTNPRTEIRGGTVATMGC